MSGDSYDIASQLKKKLEEHKAFLQRLHESKAARDDLIAASQPQTALEIERLGNLLQNEEDSPLAEAVEKFQKRHGAQLSDSEYALWLKQMLAMINARILEDRKDKGP
jgi:hypothetical protein